MQARIFLILFMVVGCAQIPHKAILGKWKSDEEKTLASMALVKDKMSEKAIKLFENDFFGHLIVEYKKDTARSYFDNEQYDKEPEWEHYEVVEVNENYVKVRGDSELFGIQEFTLYIENDMIYVLTTQYQFREYFRKLK